MNLGWVVSGLITSDAYIFEDNAGRRFIEVNLKIDVEGEWENNGPQVKNILNNLINEQNDFEYDNV